MPNAKPKNPQPQIPSPKSSTPNPQPSTLDPPTRNGRIVMKHSNEIKVGEKMETIFVSGYGFYTPEGCTGSGSSKEGCDMNGRADMMVSEIVDCGLLGEGLIPSLRDARERLLVPSAKVIPERASVYAVCIECPEQPAPLSRPLSLVSGIDFSLYNQFCAPSYEQIRLSTLKHRRMTEEIGVFDFDFRDPSMPEERSRVEKRKTVRSGTIHAVAFWFRLNLDSSVSLYTGASIE